MVLDISQGENYTTIKAGESLSVNNAEDLLRALKETIGSGKDIKLDLSDVQDADISWLQILSAAHKTARANGTKISLEISKELETIAFKAGLMYQISPSDTDYKSLWNTKG